MPGPPSLKRRHGEEGEVLRVSRSLQDPTRLWATGLGLALLLVAWALSPASAQAPPSDPPVTATSAPASASVTATAPPRLGGDLRIRGESFDNPLDLDDDADDSYQFTRMRYRLWVDGRPREEVKLFFRLGGEYRWGQQSITAQGAANPPSIRDAESRVSVDNAWVDLAWPPRSGLSLRLGRQDLTYGEGFLVFDGTPADGSSSAYFDALRGSWARGRWTVDLFTAKLQDEGFGTPGRDEDLHGLYAKRAMEWKLGLEAYLLYRHQRGARAFQAGRPWAVEQPAQSTGAAGFRISRLPETGGFLAGEFAVQTGEYHDQAVREFPTRSAGSGEVGPASSAGGASDDREAVGGYLRAGWIRDCRYHGAFEVGALFLSGDDPNTARFEGWDPFYSEWPKYSELLIYTLYDATSRAMIDRTPGVAPAGWESDSSWARVAADDAGSWTNLTAGWVELRAEPVPKLRLACRGTLLGADHPSRPDGSRDRGRLLAARADLAGPVGLAVQALGEIFWPGAYYDLPSTTRGGLAVESAEGKGSPAGSRPSDRAWYARLQVTASF